MKSEAIGTFAAANVIIGAIFIGTIVLLEKGKLFSAFPLSNATHA